MDGWMDGWMDGNGDDARNCVAEVVLKDERENGSEITTRTPQQPKRPQPHPRPRVDAQPDATPALIFDTYSYELIIRIVPECRPKIIDIVASLEQADLCIQQKNIELIIFAVHPSGSTMKRVADIISDFRSPERDFYLINVPRSTALSGLVLQGEGVGQDIRAEHEWHVNMIPLDSDLITLHKPAMFRQYVVNKDPSGFKDVAFAIMQLQKMYGIIPRIAYKGHAGKAIAKFIMQMGKQDPDPSHVSPEIESLIIIDRQIDCVTPLCSQLTYEGLIDEVYGITLGFASIPSTLVPDSPPDQKTRRIVLNSSVQIFNDLRGLHWLQVGPLLSRRSKMLRQDVTEGRGALNELSEMKKFTSKLHHIKLEQKYLPIHTNIAGELKKILTDEDFMQNYHTQHAILGIQSQSKLFKFPSFFKRNNDAGTSYIEGCIGRAEPLPKVLRLLCLQSLVNGGLKQSTLDFFRREIIQTYGYEHIITLDNLTLAGLLTPYSADKATFPHLSRAFNLIDDVPEDDAQLEDYHFTYMGYAPLSVRVVEELVKPDRSGLITMNEILKLMPGPHDEKRQHIPPGLKPRGTDDEQQRPPITVVCYVGGITHAEIAALRFLSRRQGREFVVLTTDIITGTTFLNNLSDRLRPSPHLEAALGRDTGAASSRKSRDL
eukprot:gene10164-2326_t